MDKSAQIAYFDERAETWDEICSHNPDKLRTLVTLCGIAPGAVSYTHLDVYKRQYIRRCPRA